MTKRIFNFRNVAMIACLAATIVFAACEKKPDDGEKPTDGKDLPYSDYFGTWKISANSWVTISANMIEWYDTYPNLNLMEDRFCTISGLTWTETQNPGGDYVSDYPVGYRVTGTFGNSSSGYTNVPKADGSGNCTKGDIALNTFYISADRKSIKRGNWSTAEQEATGGTYEKSADIEYCQITYNLNGGEWMADNNVITKVVKGGKILRPDHPVKGDLVFDDWHTSAALTSYPFRGTYSTFEVTDNITLYAKWSVTYLQKAVYSMGYSIQIANWVGSGQKPTSITDVLTVNYVGVMNTLSSVDILSGNYTHVSYWADGGRQRPEAIVIHGGVAGGSSIRNGTYNYAGDPYRIIAVFFQYQPNNPFVSLINLQKITNNPAITQNMYDNIRGVFPSNSYKMIVFGINSKKELMGKYIGFTTDGRVYNYFCIDPASPEFGSGKLATMNSPIY